LTFLIATSIHDEAAINITNKLIDRYHFEKIEQYHNRGLGEVYRRDNILLAYIKEDSINAEGLDSVLEVEGIIFPSRHKSESGEPTLTVHVPGNPTLHASHGGKPCRLAWAWPQRMRNALAKLEEDKDKLSQKYKVSLEATHHGPTELKVPTWFVEIGSSERFWKSEEAGVAIADAIWASLNQPLKGKSAVGFGGGHYAPKHTELCIRGDLAIGHIFPKYVIKDLKREVIEQAFEKTVKDCRVAVIDWKGIRGSERRKLIQMLEELSVEEIIRI
jgi:D-aminoacyl-tRNA deacylase